MKATHTVITYRFPPFFFSERISEKLLTTENQLREVQQEYQKTLGQQQEVMEKKSVLQVSTKMGDDHF